MPRNEMHFVLPSNSSMQTHRENQASDYKVDIEGGVKLSGDWEVALTDVHYPLTWFNVSEWTQLDFRILGTIRDGEAVNEPKHFSVHLSPGNFKTVPAMVAYINRRILQQWNFVYGPNQAEAPFSFHYDARTRYADIKAKEENSSVTLVRGTEMMSALGFNAREGGFLGLPASGLRRVDLEQHFPALYIYCDLIEWQRVGHRTYPLLRRVPIQSLRGDRYAYKEFLRPYYFRVSNPEFSQIHIWYCNDKGTVVKFERGVSCITLHFKKCGLE